MAEKLGWPRKPIGWEELRQLAADPKGWDSIAPDEKWGRFKFGHTHPDYSNSGLIAVFAQIYAAAGKDKAMTVKDVEDQKTAQFLRELQRAVVQYGSSTGFYGDAMFAHGPDYISAAVLYENMVVESYGDKWKGKLQYPVVAIYPKEGTFYSDHPVGVVERDWVKPEHKEAARLYIDFLLKEDQQRKALKYGFRPGLEKLALAAPIDEAHGVNPKEPLKLLPTPPVEVMRASLKAWKDNKKNARIVLVLDKSGSMRDEKRMINAQQGATEILTQLNDNDSMALLAFDHKLDWVQRAVKLKDGRARLADGLKSIEPKGRTALYDAVEAAYASLQAEPDPDAISAMVVLTDGDDTDSKLKLEALLDKIRQENRKNPIKIYTIAYGSDADVKVLKKIAEAAQGKDYEARPETVGKVIRDIATFF
jgi:Ca-activated chloride channel family protein